MAEIVPRDEFRAACGSSTEYEGELPGRYTCVLSAGHEDAHFNGANVAWTNTVAFLTKREERQARGKR